VITKGGVNIKYDWIFWCDGNQFTGLGHLSRCLGYAEILADNNLKCIFYGDYDEVAQSLITNSGLEFQITKLIGEKEWIKETPVHLGQRILLDSYNITAADISKIKQLENVKKIILMDDFCFLDYYDSDAVINFTVGAIDIHDVSIAYKTTHGNKPPNVFIGPKYYPARRWLRKVREERELIAIPDVKKVLVVSGGRDRTGVTANLLELIWRVNNKVEIAALMTDGKENESVNFWLDRFPITHRLKHQPDLGEWYKWADICLCGGGLIKYECLYVGLPVASLAQTKEQHNDSLEHSRLGLICDLGLVNDMQIEKEHTKLKKFIDNISCGQDNINKGRALVGSVDTDHLLDIFTTI